jgi:hypothetical protein
VSAEENETPGGESGGGAQPGGLGAEGRGRRSEGDLLAERRARRAAESGEHALTLRAEAAEATVRTLETHVASLQQRLREVEEDRRRVSELVEAERAARGGDWRSQAPPSQAPPGAPQAEAPPSQALPGARQAEAPPAEALLERELRRVGQREYAEQRLRVEAEDRCIEIEREGRAEIDQLSRRLSASERDARTLAAELEDVQRQLAEAEHAAAAQRAAVRSAERLLQARMAELERRAVELNRGLDIERTARERAERLLESIRHGHRTAEALVGELRGVVARLKAAAAAPPLAQAPAREPPVTPREQPSSAVPGGPGKVQNGEMAQALAAAVERLRARAEEQPELPRAPVVRPPAHKHSMSLITRWRIRRKQRRDR